MLSAHEMDLGEVSYQMEMRGPENKLEFTAHLFIENPAGIAKDTGEKDESLALPEPADHRKIPVSASAASLLWAMEAAKGRH